LALDARALCHAHPWAWRPFFAVPAPPPRRAPLCTPPTFFLHCPSHEFCARLMYAADLFPTRRAAPRPCVRRRPFSRPMRPAAAGQARKWGGRLWCSTRALYATPRSWAWRLLLLFPSFHRAAPLCTPPTFFLHAAPRRAAPRPCVRRRPFPGLCGRPQQVRPENGVGGFGARRARSMPRPSSAPRALVYAADLFPTLPFARILRAPYVRRRPFSYIVFCFFCCEFFMYAPDYVCDI
jgi:hypothetical protein